MLIYLGKFKSQICSVWWGEGVFVHLLHVHLLLGNVTLALFTVQIWFLKTSNRHGFMLFAWLQQMSSTFGKIHVFNSPKCSSLSAGFICQQLWNLAVVEDKAERQKVWNPLKNNDKLSRLVLTPLNTLTIGVHSSISDERERSCPPSNAVNNATVWRM